MLVFVLLVGCVVEGVPAKLMLVPMLLLVVLVMITYMPSLTLWLPDLVLGPE